MKAFMYGLKFPHAWTRGWMPKWCAPPRLDRFSINNCADVIHVSASQRTARNIVLSTDICRIEKLALTWHHSARSCARQLQSAFDKSTIPRRQRYGQLSVVICMWSCRLGTRQAACLRLADMSVLPSVQCLR